MASRDPSVQDLFSFVQKNRNQEHKLHVFFKDDVAYTFEIQFEEIGQHLKAIVPKTNLLETLYQEINGNREFYFGHCSPDVQKGAYAALDMFDDSKNLSLNQVLSFFVGPAHKNNTRNHSYNANRHFVFSVPELEHQGFDDLVQFARENDCEEYISITKLAKYFERSDIPEITMGSQQYWLMTFNPLNTTYQYTIDDWVELLSKAPNAIDSWSTGGTKTLRNGDTIYVLRQGKDARNDQRGIVGKGKIISDTYVDENNKIRVDIQVEKGVAAPPRSLSLQALLEIFPDHHWTPQGSGTSIPEEIAEYLEEQFAKIEDTSLQAHPKNIGRTLQEILTELKALPNFDVFAFANIIDLERLTNADLAVKTKTFETLKERWEENDTRFNFYIQNKSTSGKALDGQTLTYKRRKQFFEQMRPILEQYHFQVEGIYNKSASHPHALITGFQNDELPELEAEFGASSHHMFLTIHGKKQSLNPRAAPTAEESISQYTATPLPKPSKETVQRIERLKHFKNLILEGVPGTGKTFALNMIKLYWHNQTKRPLFIIHEEASPFAMTFHPSTSYEDFVEGLRPLTSNDNHTSLEERKKSPEAVWFYDKLPAAKGNWGIKDGFFLKICHKAIQHPHHDFIILIDELNRANIPKVFGDLITTIERSKRALWNGSFENIEHANPSNWNTEKCQIVELPYSGRKFFVPDNIYIVATQNTTDRSVAPLDAALRRRFAFLRIHPHSYEQIRKHIALNSFQRSLLTWARINTKLQEEIGPDAVLGHAYFYVVYEEVKEKDEDLQYSALRFVWEQELLPQIVDTLQSADRIDLLEEFQEMFDELDPQYRFQITISGEALYRLPIISLEEKNTSKMASDE